MLNNQTFKYGTQQKSIEKEYTFNKLCKLLSVCVSAFVLLKDIPLKMSKLFSVQTELGKGTLEGKKVPLVKCQS